MPSNDSDRAFRRAAFDIMTCELRKRSDIAATEYRATDVDFTEVPSPVVFDEAHMKREVPKLHQHQQAIADKLREQGPTVILSQVETLQRDSTFDAIYGGGLREGDMLVTDFKLRRHHDPDPAEPMVIDRPKRRTQPSPLVTIMMASVAAAAGIDLDNPFAALERRVLSREEALEAFKTTDVDKARIAAAEAKRARKAAKLNKKGSSHEANSQDFWKFDPSPEAAAKAQQFADAIGVSLEQQDK